MSKRSTVSVKSFDLFAKLPLDLSEPTKQGAFLSVCALIFMATLFIMELWTYMSPDVYSTVMLDTNSESKLRINFNITMMSLPCELTSIDVLDVLGTNRVNVTKNIIKWHIDDQGRRAEFHGRNREQEDIKHDEHHREIALAHEDGEHAVPITEAAWPDYIAGNSDVIVDFYAPWCVWCQRLAPTWEAFAENAQVSLPELRVVKVDCVENNKLCQDQQIHAFPTIRFFKDGKPSEHGDYKKDRSLTALLEYSKAEMGEDTVMLKSFSDGAVKAKRPGCQISGFIMVNRVPGNFHIESRSKHQNINPTMANVSHTINSLSFGSQRPNRHRGDLTMLDGASSIENEVHVTKELHSAPHHYINVVSTYLGKEWHIRQSEDVLKYQMVTRSQIMPYAADQIPEAKFAYDLSPMCVHVKTRRKHWYSFITSAMAIVGGTFTVVGVLDALLFRLLKAKKV